MAENLFQFIILTGAAGVVILFAWAIFQRLTDKEKCTCGSGGHPRRCLIHPLYFDQHIKELSEEDKEK